jgi:prephenate dehydrogenase
MAGHLAPYFEVLAHDPKEPQLPEGVKRATLAEAAAADVVVLAVPVQDLEKALQQIGPRLKPGAVVLDVASVKQIPVGLMEKYVPASCEILATHPLFGPQSGQQGIAGMTVVTWPVRISDERYAQVQAFLRDKLKLEVHEVSPDEHDREMAYVQALTFLIGKALGDLDIPNTPLKTATYQHLIDIERIVQNDTGDLFETVELYNPEAAAVRRAFVDRLDQIEARLEEYSSK